MQNTDGPSVELLKTLPLPVAKKWGKRLPPSTLAVFHLRAKDPVMTMDHPVHIAVVVDSEGTCYAARCRRPAHQYVRSIWRNVATGQAVKKAVLEGWAPMPGNGQFEVDTAGAPSRKILFLQVYDNLVRLKWAPARPPRPPVSPS